VELLIIQYRQQISPASGGRWRHSPTARSTTADPERFTHCWCVIL